MAQKTIKKLKTEREGRGRRKIFQKYEVREIAEQLSLIDENFFRQIHLNELSSKNKPNISQLIEFFNSISSQIIYECLQGNSVEKSGESITYFIHLAKELYKINNYDILMSVMAALNNSIINRLKSSWNYVKNEILLIFDELNEFVSHLENYKQYRARIIKLTESKSLFLPIFCSIPPPLPLLFLFIYK